MNDNQKTLMEKLFRIVTLLHRYNYKKRFGKAPFGDPHRGQGRVLSILKLKSEISQRELAYILEMRSQSLGELLLKLEKNGYIIRTPSESDRRVMDIKLTDAGREAADKNEERQQSFDKLFDCLTEDEQSNFGAYLDRLIAELENHTNDDIISEFGSAFENFKELGKHFIYDADLFTDKFRRYYDRRRGHDHFRDREQCGEDKCGCNDCCDKASDPCECNEEYGSVPEDNCECGGCCENNGERE